jgi:hypothetical protein
MRYLVCVKDILSFRVDLAYLRMSLRVGLSVTWNTEYREGESRDSENFSALSAGAYITTWLVRVT